MAEIKLTKKDYNAIINNLNIELSIAKEIIRELLKDFNYLCDVTNNSSNYSSIDKAETFLKE